MIDQVSQKLLEHGLPGIIILVLGFVVWQLVKRIDAAYAMIAALQETRVEESKATLEAVNAQARAMEKLTEAIERRR